MFMITVFGIVTATIIVYLLQVTKNNFAMLKTHKLSVKYLGRVLSSLGLVIPLEFFFLYFFISLYGSNHVFDSAIYSQDFFAVSNNLTLSVIGQQAFIVNFLKLVSTITLGSCFALSIGCFIGTTMLLKKTRNKSGNFEIATDEDTEYDIPEQSSYVYLQFCRLLS